MTRISLQRIIWILAMTALVAQPALAQRGGGRSSNPTPTPAAAAESGGGQETATDPELATAMNLLRGWRTEAARDLLESEREVAGGTPQFKTAWALVEAQEGELADALEALTAVANSAKGDPAPQYLRGEVLLMQDKLDAATSAWGKARDRAQVRLDADSSDGEASYYLGAAKIRLRQFAEAREPLQDALEADWNPAAVRYQLGLSFLFERNWSAAIEQLDAALEKDAKLAHAYYYRGLAWQQQGRVDKALNDLDTFVTLAPDSPEADSARTMLEAGRR